MNLSLLYNYLLTREVIFEVKKQAYGKVKIKISVHNKVAHIKRRVPFPNLLLKQESQPYGGSSLTFGGKIPTL